MKQLSHDETRELVNSYVKSFSQRGAARHLTKIGYRSPEGKPISQGHIARILSGSQTCFQSPGEPKETRPDSQKARKPPKEPISSLVVNDEEEKEEKPAPWQPKPLLDKTVADNFAPVSEEEKQRIDDAKAFEELQREEEALAELEALEEKEHRPTYTKHIEKVPTPSDYTHREHVGPLQHARMHAIFDRRQDVEFEEDETGEPKLFFGIPRLRHGQPHTTSRPYQPKSFGQNRLSTR